MIRIWTALKKLRASRGHSQAQLAKLMQCSKNTVAKYEGKNSDPTWSYIERVMAAVEASPADLMRALGAEVAHEPVSSEEALPEEVVD